MILVEICILVLEKMIFNCTFAIISPWKRMLPFIWTNLNSLHPKMLCANCCLNWPCGSGEKDEIVKCSQTVRWTDDGKEEIRKALFSGRLKCPRGNEEPPHVLGGFPDVLELLLEAYDPLTPNVSQYQLIRSLPIHYQYHSTRFSTVVYTCIRAQH